MGFVYRLRFQYLAAVACVAALVAIAIGGVLYNSHRQEVARLQGESRAALEAGLRDAALQRARDRLQALEPDFRAPLDAGDLGALAALVDRAVAQDGLLTADVRDARGLPVATATRPGAGGAGKTGPVGAIELPIGRADAPLGTLAARVSLAEVASGVATLDARLVAARGDLGRAELLLFGGTALGLLLLLAGGAWLLATRVRRPIDSIIRVVDRMGDGDYERPLGVERRDELGDLAEAVERMRRRLRQTTVTQDYVDVLLNGMTDAVLLTSPEGHVKRVNDAAARLLGWSEAELLGRPFADLLAPEGRDGFAMEAAAHQTRETTMRTKAGESVPVSVSGSTITAGNPQLEGVLFVARNISERKHAERRIRYLARYDALTKVPNRMQFQHLLQQAIARAHRTGTAVALLYLDLDRFKDVNDTFGHAAGDRTLEILSERLTRLVPKDATTGRLAGDEFGVFVENLPADADPRATLASLAKELIDDVSRAFWLNEEEIYLSCSVGVAAFPQDADNTIDLIRNADAAMYHAKQNGGGAWAFYQPEMNAVAVERLMLKSKLRRSLERDEFVIRYQPKVSLRDGRITGAEALLRWRLPGHGDIPPAQFIPLAEETSLILPIGEWVLKRVCTDYRSWRDADVDPGRISINLSLKQLKQASFITRFASVFREKGVSPTTFELEITETTLMDDARHTVKLLDELYAMGIHLSIDDFGTGYSSLSALQQLPVETLKIDQSFVRDAAIDRDDATLVRTIIEMGRSLDMEVVAEGVETREQLDFLRERGCHHAQGRLFGEPLTAGEFVALLKAEAAGQRPYGRHFATPVPGVAATPRAAS